MANAKLAYQLFQERHSGARWEALAAQGAKVQRPLWASTSTKNPEYSDTLYVDELVGPRHRQHPGARLDRGAARPRRPPARHRGAGRRWGPGGDRRAGRAGVDYDDLTRPSSGRASTPSPAPTRTSSPPSTSARKRSRSVVPAPTRDLASACTWIAAPRLSRRRHRRLGHRRRAGPLPTTPSSPPTAWPRARWSWSTTTGRPRSTTRCRPASRSREARPPTPPPASPPSAAVPHSSARSATTPSARSSSTTCAPPASSTRPLRARPGRRRPGASSSSRPMPSGR